MPVSSNPAFTVVRAIVLYAILLVLVLYVGFWFEKTSANVSFFTALNGQMPGMGGEAFWAFFTSLGDTSVAVVLIWLLLPKNAASFAQITLAMIIGGGVSPLIKNYFDYPRPLGILGDSVLVVGPSLQTHGFVSGHTLTAFLVAALIAMNVKRKWSIFAYIVAVIVGISRIMVGAHWPADVLTGAIVGWGAGRLIGVVAGSLSAKSEKILAVAGMVLLVIAVAYLALGKMVNIKAIIWFWQGFSVLTIVLLFRTCRHYLSSSFMLTSLFKTKNRSDKSN